MFKTANIQECFKEVVGFLPTTNPCFLPHGFESSSNLYFDNAHPLVNTDNCIDLLTRSDYRYDAWDAAANYVKGKYVEHDGVVYLCVQNAIAGTPLNNTDYWITLVYKLLADKLSGYYVQFVNEILSLKKDNLITKSLLEDKYLYRKFATRNDYIVKSGRFVGYRVDIAEHENVNLHIRRLGFQFSEPQTDLPIYVYHSSKLDAPIHVANITTAGQFSFEWVDFGFDFYFADANLGPGGYYLLGYYEDDLTGQALNADVNWDKSCTFCSDRDSYLYNMRSVSPYVKFSTVYFPSGALSGTEFPDQNMASCVNNTNFGINAQITVSCDLTDFFCRNVDLCRLALQKFVACKLLSEFANSTRMNRIKEEVAALAAADYDKIKKESDRLMQNLNFDFSDLGSICLPCGTSGVKVTSM